MALRTAGHGTRRGRKHQTQGYVRGAHSSRETIHKHPNLKVTYWYKLPTKNTPILRTYTKRRTYAETQKQTHTQPHVYMNHKNSSTTAVLTTLCPWPSLAERRPSARETREPPATAEAARRTARPPSHPRPQPPSPSPRSLQAPENEKPVVFMILSKESGGWRRPAIETAAAAASTTATGRSTEAKKKRVLDNTATTATTAEATTAAATTAAKQQQQQQPQKYHHHHFHHHQQ